MSYKQSSKNFYNKYKSFIHMGIIVITAFSLAFVLTSYMVISSTVVGTSMQNTLKDGDKGIGLGTSLIRDIERFDIVTFRHGDDVFVKRVIGLPNERIEYSSGVLKINDVVVEEDFELANAENTGTFIRNLGRDEYFVMGDNRGNSFDSRSFGPISRDSIVSKHFLVFVSCRDTNIQGECQSARINWPYLAR